ncbi:efflux RND transporter periplasmic adaptor subunit [Mucilaginibacter pallidiroseus]|uniref:Efflux RND transporter periplasmic adaptor subunit n=1 Tax=Mucilaginibacter pallidiroseus TaxID=2599295 RepID=A0A563U1E0_9SPHI|nr:efflux RND transporter periplasmic adaptor subunit [Mucilaginibacter pallidiroseus]TWR25220.1 efflux RND transporter periplasmic adaptor subunit [Mucilaginibacter pallidiroseus]
MKNFKLNSLLLACAVALAAVGCSSKAKDKKEGEEMLELPVYSLTSRDTTIQKAYVADIQAHKNIEIRNRVRGFLEHIYVDEGKQVSKGQLLFKINDQEFRVKLTQAQAALSNAMADAKATELEVSRVKMLVEKKVISKSELEVAQSKYAADLATVQEARSLVQSAKDQLSYTSVRAPFDGIIDRIPLKSGSLIDEGALLTNLSDISSMYAYFSFPENEYLQYVRNRKIDPDKTSNEVRLVLADGIEFPEKGTIETVEGEIEQSTGSINFRAKFANPQKLLRHGATGKLYISTRADSVIMVPQQSVFDIQDKSYVYVLGAGNKLQMQSFEPLTRLAHFYLVKDGLKAGDKILYEGVQNVRDGMAIKPKVVTKPKFVAMK